MNTRSLGSEQGIEACIKVGTQSCAQPASSRIAMLGIGWSGPLFSISPKFKVFRLGKGGHKDEWVVGILRCFIVLRFSLLSEMWIFNAHSHQVKQEGTVQIASVTQKLNFAAKNCWRCLMHC